MILILRGGIIMPIGNLPECLSQHILAGRILVGRLGVFDQRATHPSPGFAATIRSTLPYALAWRISPPHTNVVGECRAPVAPYYLL